MIEGGPSETHSPLGLKAWMEARGATEVSLRDIMSAAPRAFRRKVGAEVALAALVEKGEIEQISEWPKVYRLAADKDLAASSPVESFATRCAPAPAREEAWPIPLREVAAILQDKAKRQNDGKLPAPAVWLMAFKEARRVLRRDPRLASRQRKPDRCFVCDAAGNLVDVKSGPNTLRLHLGTCFNQFSQDVRGREDAIMLAAIQMHPGIGRLTKPNANGGNQ